MPFIQDSLKVGSITTLKTLTSSSSPKRVDGGIYAVDSNGSVPAWYLYSASSTATESLPSIVSPNDTTGRFIQFTSPLNTVNAYTKTQYPVPVVNNSASGAVTLDGSASNIFILTLTGNLTLSMNNVQVGATYIIYLMEDATGGAVITLNSIFKRISGDTTTFNTAANKVNVLTGIARASNAITLFPIAVED